MKVNEIRIGNWVYLISKNKWYQIESGHDIDEGIDSNDFEPILITEDWLLRFGFEKTELNGGIIKQYAHDCTPPRYRNNYGLIFRFGEMRDEPYKMYWYATDPINSSMHSFPCKFIHQLQNLYFALTGNELTINNNQL